MWMMVDGPAVEAMGIYNTIQLLAPSDDPDVQSVRWDLAVAIRDRTSAAFERCAFARRAAANAVDRAIADATSDPDERRVLARIALYESGLSPTVARCAERGYEGNVSLGLYQISPQTSEDFRQACSSIAAQTSLAVRYVRASFVACPANIGADRLAMYVSGTCTRGLRQARERWGVP